MTYYKDAAERAKRRKSPWNLILIPLAIMGIGSAYYLIYSGLLELQRNVIPANSILSSVTRVGMIVSGLPIFFLAIPLGFMFANVITWAIPQNSC